MGLDVLVVSISTVACETAFSTSGRILDAYRSLLTPRLVQSLICAQEWIRGRTSHSYVGLKKNLQKCRNLMKV